jgi:threonine/homoserine/homoserine lactone efflux protein
MGAVLGLSAGLSPGPLLALVIAQTLRHGPREGALVAAAPLVTDLPIILLSVLALARAEGHAPLLGAVSLAGSAYLLHMAYDTFRAGPPGDGAEGDGARPRSLLKGALTNALSPHPWLFWLTVGAPAILSARAAGVAAPLLFVGAFTACLVGSKVAVALLVARSARWLRGAAYAWILRSLGALLLLFALFLAVDGLRRLGAIAP